jgi:hypothetical protein
MKRKEMYMEFLKKFFNDDSTVVGLCKFDRVKSKYIQTPAETDFFFNPFEQQKNYKTNIENNLLLL